MRLRMAVAIAAMWEQAECAQTQCGICSGFRRDAYESAISRAFPYFLVELWLNFVT